jgi:hypothetical protein
MMMNFKCVDIDESNRLSNALNKISSGKLRKIMNASIEESGASQEYFLTSFFTYYRDKIGDEPSDRFLESALKAHAKNCKQESNSTPGRARQVNSTITNYTAFAQEILKEVCFPLDYGQNFVNAKFMENENAIEAQVRSIEGITRRMGFSKKDFACMYMMAAVSPSAYMNFRELYPRGLDLDHFVTGDTFHRTEFETFLRKTSTSCMLTLNSWATKEKRSDTMIDKIKYLTTAFASFVGVDDFRSTLRKWQKL